MGFERAKAALVGTRFADLQWVEETGSTNADVMEMLAGRRPEGGPREPIVLLAEHQTAGRGRLDRSWEAPKGTSLLMSIGLAVDLIPPERRTLLTSALAVAVTDAVEGLRIKWPNDLVAVGAGEDGGDRKVGGILAEARALAGVGDCVVLGLGLNLNWPEIPEELAGTATSLNLLLGGEVDREVVLVDLLVSLDSRWLPLVEASAPSVDELLDVYRARSATLGRTVRAELASGSVVGTAEDISVDGALVIEDAEGVRRTVTAGDVIHLR